MEMPIIRIEIERLKSCVNTMLSTHSIELNAYVKKSIEDQIQAEWVMQEIDMEVKTAIHKAIKGISNNYHLTNAIEDLIARTLAEKFRENKQ